MNNYSFQKSIAMLRIMDTQFTHQKFRGGINEQLLKGSACSQSKSLFRNSEHSKPSMGGASTSLLDVRGLKIDYYCCYCCCCFCPPLSTFFNTVVFFYSRCLLKVLK